MVQLPGTCINYTYYLVAVIGMPVQGAGVAVGTSSRVSGWGAISEGGPGSPTLLAVYVPVVSNAACNAAYGGGVTDGMICAGFPEGNLKLLLLKLGVVINSAYV